MLRNMTRLWFFCALALFAGAMRVSGAGPVQSPHVESELVSEAAAIAPGQPFTVALRMKMEPHWHTYWVNPGDSGLATSIEWTLPEGFVAGPIQFPAPERIPTPPLMTYGFEGEIFLLVEITPPEDLQPGDTVTLRARADWLVCKEMCIPGGAEYELTLPVAGRMEKDARWAPKIAEARALIPVKDSRWHAVFVETDDGFRLYVEPPQGVDLPAADAYFFAVEEGVVEPAAEQMVSREGGYVVFSLKRSSLAEPGLERLAGVVVSDAGPVLLEAARVDAAPMAAGVAAAVDNGGALSLALVLPLAFLGGLILNLMPCVFPVLGIKILGFVNQAGADRRKVTLHGLVFTFGVLVSFWILAGVLIVLRAGGQELGWGFQLQSPEFVFVLAVFLLIFALNLSGLFEVGLSATGVGATLQMKGGFAGSFFTGVLATVVATPCSAPFLAPALGAALALPAATSVLVFTVIALGLAVPYLILSIFPGLVRFLPRPGPWMEAFKQFMAFPLYATVAFLVWVLAGQVSEAGLLKVFVALILVAMAAWAYGRWVQGLGGTKARRFGITFAGVAFAAGLWLGFPSHDVSREIQWEKWSPQRVAELQAQGRIVYVDFTARWCATCQSNKALVFSSEKVRQAFRELEVVPLKADWTNRDPEITRALEAFGRSAVPFNLIYAPDAPEPIVLPEILTADIVLEALAKASGKRLSAR